MAKYNWDFIGIGTSILCAIHCTMLPIISSATSLFSSFLWLHNVYFEWMMILLTIIIGIYALWHSYQKHHRNNLPIIFLILGSCMLVSKQIFHKMELYFLVPAIIFMLLAHSYNYTLSKKYKCDNGNHKH